MKKILVALSMVAFLAACGDSSSASAENNEPTTLSSIEEEGSSSSSSVTSAGSVTLSSSSLLLSDEGVLSRSSSSETKTESSSSEKLSETSSCSEDDDEYSSSSVILATPCKTETEDNCEYGTLLDDRDGQTYKTVKIGNQWWMAENLNYAYTGVPFDYNGYTSDSTSWCYDNDPANCAKYGRLYTWAAAKDSVGTWSMSGKGCGYGKTCSVASAGSATLVRGVCPKGWHLPSDDEWEALFTAVGGSSTAGSKLKSATGWSSSGNGTDTFGFSALPAGYRVVDGYYDGEGIKAYFWSSTEYDSYFAYFMFLYYYDDYAYLDYNGKYFGFSVRCLKDKQAE